MEENHKVWMTLFGINFAIGVATGLILEFNLVQTGLTILVCRRYFWSIGY